jgi:hypothetical protein
MMCHRFFFLLLLLVYGHSLFSVLFFFLFVFFSTAPLVGVFSLTPWSTHLFERLHDDAVSVRKSSLMVISHMILNGVLKGRGQMAPVAACLEDAERKVADLANLFFHELSKRAGNPIYNLLPDTISQLSKDPTVSVLGFGEQRGCMVGDAMGTHICCCSSFMFCR